MFAIPMVMTAQNEGGNVVTVTGSIQSDVLFPQEDEDIGAMESDHKVLTNSYADVHVISKHVDAGARVEFMRFPLPGYENDFKGWGLANIYAKMHTDKLEVTLGNFYEQFGSGFILRTYEERSLGIDNSLLGARVTAKPVKGVMVKGLAGWQRHYWSYNDALISGGDLQLSIDQWSKALQDNGTYLSLGASMVNKHERTEDVMWDYNHLLNLPENVNAFDFRASLQKGNVSVLAEYAFKTQDPSSDNKFIYRRGHVAMLSASYSKRGMSILLQAKRSDNMSFRSKRMERGTSSFINHLPAFTLDHTYALAALYPYATQPDGEWAYQAELGYNFKRNTFLGGKYGTNVKVNFSHVHSIDKNVIPIGAPHDTNGYGSAFWKWGDGMYYQDFDIQVDKRITKDFKLNLMYMNQFYNKTVIEGEGGMVHSDIFVADGKYKFNNKVTLRGELQYLATKDDEGDWAFALLELSVLPRLMFTVSDMYNCGETDLHYYQGLVTFTYGAHRLQAGYGRTRAGYNCSGGVCRYIPATKGFTLSYNYNF
ncbi:MAG: hypothetical protein J5548_00250 [Prevotella sp.]|nr:hypothetical protein [Prevotella sp.]